MDMYSRVKLRKLTGKFHGGRHNDLGLYDVKSISSNSGKYMGYVGIKSRTGKNESKIREVNSSKLAKIKWKSQALKMTSLVALTTVEVDIPYVDGEHGQGGGIILETHRTLDEDTAVEVLGALKERRLLTMQNEFKLGDLVWGKVKSHPWWPGQIFDEALVPSSSVKKTKIDGFLLVIFFGDNTYRWLDPKDLIPFEPHYLEKKNPSIRQTQTFLMAVQEAVDELNKSAALGFACRCQNSSNFQPANASGLLKANLSGYEEAAIYSVDLLKRSRAEFKPVEMLFFLQQLALDPINMRRDGDFLKNVARILAYMKAAFKKKDDTYCETFQELPRIFVESMEDANHRGEALVQVPSSGQSLTSETRGECKILGKLVKLDKPIDGQKISEIGPTLDEDTAIAVLGTLKERIPVTIGSKFKLGDLVWGKVKSHPWWPGQIFDEALASSSSVKGNKAEGFLLVVFFGDDTYRWLSPTELIPFEPHYFEKKNQLKIQTQTFVMAVQEAISELHRRVALGFACPCRKPFNFLPANASGLQKVEINDYEEGATFSVDQVQKSREEFSPVKMLSFLEQLALRPIDTPTGGDFLKNLARILAYRKAVFEEKDNTYYEAFELLPRTLTGSMEDADDHGETLFRGTGKASLSIKPEAPGLKSQWKVTLSGQCVTSEARGEGKVLGKRMKFEKSVDGQKRSRADKLTNSSRDLIKVLIKEEEIEEPGAILVMKFPPRATVPSVSVLKASFTRFGPLDISATYASWNSSTCQVGFKKISDAQVAYDYVVRSENLFGNTRVSYIYKFLQPLRMSHNCVPQAVVRERVEVIGEENLLSPQKLILERVMP